MDKGLRQIGLQGNEFSPQLNDFLMVPLSFAFDALVIVQNAQSIVRNSSGHFIHRSYH
jgi:hypothetical protein